jgi:magnesium-transporting ATPase (P-type)
MFDAVLGFIQEGKGQATLAPLKCRLSPNASVRRDREWKALQFGRLGAG